MEKIVARTTDSFGNYKSKILPSLFKNIQLKNYSPGKQMNQKQNHKSVDCHITYFPNKCD